MSEHLVWQSPWPLIVLAFGSAAWVVVFGGLLMAGYSLSERRATRFLLWLSRGGMALSAVIFIQTCVVTPLHGNLPGSQWLVPGRVGGLSFLVTPATGAYVLVAHILLAGVARFAATYLHRERGYQRFMMLMALMQCGVLVASFAKELGWTFFGWELVGLSSVLLIGFYEQHAFAGRASVKAFVSYKIADTFLLAVVALVAACERGVMAMPVAVAYLLVIGSLAKGGQLPFVAWMPRAMEGPTPSSAAFYGGISAHMAPILLIKTSALWGVEPGARALALALGVATSIFASYTARAQSNIKARLAYGVMAQIGIMYAEIALGFETLAVVHLCGHAALRTWQFLYSPSLLGQSIVASRRVSSRRLPHARLYIHAVNHFYVETALKRLLIQPFLRAAALIAAEAPEQVETAVTESMPAFEQRGVG